VTLMLSRLLYELDRLLKWDITFIHRVNSVFYLKTGKRVEKFGNVHGYMSVIFFFMKYL